MSWENLLYETTKISAGLAEENIRLQNRVESLQRQIKKLKVELEAEKIKFNALNLSVRSSVDCSVCNNQRWIWSTCGEGTCDINDPCHECNGDQLLPMDWDRL